MQRTLVHVGFGNMIVAERIVAIIQPSSSPVKRLKEEARDAGRLIDATKGIDPRCNVKSSLLFITIFRSSRKSSFEAREYHLGLFFNPVIHGSPPLYTHAYI